MSNNSLTPILKYNIIPLQENESVLMETNIIDYYND